MTTNLRATFPELFSDELTATAFTTTGHQVLTMTHENATALVGELLWRLAQIEATKGG